MATGQKRKIRKPPPAPSLPPGALRLEYLDPAQLDDNPANWRTHPELQGAALRGAIAEVGWAGALLYNEQTKRLCYGLEIEPKYVAVALERLAGLGLSPTLADPVPMATYQP